MTAAVVDLGALRAEKKEVTLSTDAAALAAVASIDYADSNATGNGTDCSGVRSIDAPEYPTVEDVAHRYLTENGDSKLGTCKIFFGATGANQTYLTVTASDDVEYAFGKATGQESGSTGGVSSARAGSASVDGVYPIGYCANDGLLNFVDDQASFPQPFGGQRQITLDFGNSNCDSNGNHDQIDFGNFVPGCGQANAPGQFCYDLNNGGFDGTVPPAIGSNPGGSWNQTEVETPIADLESRAVHIWVPAVGVGGSNGNPGEFPVEYLVEVVITDFRPTGSDKGLTMDVYQVVDYATYAAEGLPLTTVNRQVSPHICATSADTTGCTTNPALVTPPPPPPPANNPPAASFTVTCNGLSCTFTDTSTDSDGTISTRSWDFGDATTSTEANPTKTYATPGTWTVTLNVTDDYGAASTATGTATTTSPTCAATAVSPAQGYALANGTGADLDWVISLSNPALCTGVTALLDRRNGNGDLSLTVVGIVGNQLTVRLPSTTVGSNNQVYDLVVSAGAPAMQIVGGPSQPGSTLTMG